jgi:hypothetical protein
MIPTVELGYRDMERRRRDCRFLSAALGGVLAEFDGVFFPRER